MERKKLFLIIESALCVVAALLLIAAVTGAYLVGAEAHASDPLRQIFTRETVAACLRSAGLPLFTALGMAAVGWILGVKDENGLETRKAVKVVNRVSCGKGLRTVLLIAAAALLIAGIFNGSAKDVFGKAVKICTECVGLG